MTDSTPALPNEIECPLCLGEGKLSRSEILDRLGVKDFARVAELSAQEAMRLLMAKEAQEEQGRWSRFEAELTKRLTEADKKHDAELQRLQSEKSELAARLKGLEENSSATLGNARQQERLAATQESQKELAALTKEIADLEAAQTLAEEQRNAEVAKARAELEITMSSDRAKANDLTGSAGGSSRTACGCCARPEPGCPETWKCCGRCWTG